MKEVSLFEHNEIAYKKLCDLLEKSNYATINHATGTGKSFIALKYLYEHRDKKFLYITPTYPIIDQLLDDCSKIGIDPEELNFDQIIYRTLLDKTPQEIYEEYDGFILDEYHRAGAKETYKRIKELKHLIDTSGDDSKKVIGLTATPTRYLDRERNMTNEIFDGNVASTISLSEAFASGLLPIPTYINSNNSCYKAYYTLLKKVEKLPPGDKKNDIKARLENIRKRFRPNENNIYEILREYQQSQDGKYIVFCNTIESIKEYYWQADSWFNTDTRIKKYQVHSKQSKERNQEQLDLFNEDNSQISLLFCVNILNEGVHVSNVNRIIQLRSTISPITYFQQIGRALSYSGRNDEIIIYDLVNNFNNHKAIYDVYREFQKEIERRIAENPQDKEYYEKQLSRFKIIGETRSILEELSKIEEELTPELIANAKIDYSIEFLQKFLERKKEDEVFIIDSSCKSKAARDAYFNLSRYYKYVTNDQFDSIKELNMLLPSEYAIPKEQRLEILNGANSLYESEKQKNNNALINMLDFIELNGRKPNSNIKAEKEIYEKYLEALPNLDNYQKELIYDTYDIFGINPEVYEKLIFNIPINVDTDLDIIILDARSYVTKGLELPNYLYIAVEQAIYNYNSEKHKELFDIIDMSDNIKKDKKEKEELKRKENINDIVEYLSKNIELTSSQLKNEELLKKLAHLSYGDRAYITKKYKKLRKKFLLKFFQNDDNDEFYKDIKKMDTEELKSEADLLYNRIKTFIELNDILSGEPDEFEGRLQELANKGKINPQIIKYCLDDTILGCNSADLIRNICYENICMGKNKITIIRALNFLRINNRSPLTNSSDPSEKQLAEDFRQTLEELPKKYSDKIRSSFNSLPILRKTIQQYASNDLEQREER